jgi:hypothetical protein
MSFNLLRSSDFKEAVKAIARAGPGYEAFDAAHTKKRKRMEPEKLQYLVYVRMNNHFKKTMASKEKVDLVPIDIVKIHAYEGDFENEREEN